PQQPMVPPHVQKFDGEHIRRPPHLFRTHQQRRPMLLLPPPRDRRSQSRNRSERSLAEHAQQIYVREIGNVISRRRRPIKDHRQQIRPRRSAHPFDKFVNQFFRNHSVPLTLWQVERRASRPSRLGGAGRGRPGTPLPTATGPAAARAPTATTAKTTKPSSTISTTPTAAHVV